MNDLTRRNFLATTGAVAGGMMLPTLSAVADNPTAGAKHLRVLQVGVGGIGGLDRGRIASHPNASIVGLVDVDRNILADVAEKFPDAFTDTDYRKVFADRLDEFDAVNVCTPDHNHIGPMMLALKNDKHLYAQKPLVQQLEELEILAKAAAAKPNLATQTGNQRMERKGRVTAVDILERDLLGPAIESWIWTGTVRGDKHPRGEHPIQEPPPTWTGRTGLVQPRNSRTAPTCCTTSGDAGGTSAPPAWATGVFTSSTS